MILELLQTALGLVTFLLPGLLLGLLLFPRLDLIERVTYSLALSIGSLGTLAIILYELQLLDQDFFYCVTYFLIAVCAFLYQMKNKSFASTFFNRDIYILFFLTIIGTLWKLGFKLYVRSFNYIWNNPYSYSYQFIDKEVPNLGYYTGMATDRSTYIGLESASFVPKFLFIHSEIILIFLATLLYLGFIYILFKEYRLNKKLTYLGLALMSIGPIELFFHTTNIYGHALSYIAILPLFLLLKSKTKNLSWVTALFSIVLVFSYYTASVVLLLASGGFILACIIKSFVGTNTTVYATLLALLKDRRVWTFTIIAFIAFIGIFGLSDMKKFSLGKLQDRSDLKISLEKIHLTNNTDAQSPTSTTSSTTTVSLSSKDTTYENPNFFGISAIRLQIIFFFLSGCTLLLYLLRQRKIDHESLDLLLALIPVVIVSAGFFYTNYPTRIFDYFAFFGLLCMHYPQRLFRTVAILSIIFITITGIFVAKDQAVLMRISKEEVAGALEASSLLQGKLFSDQVFVNQLIKNGYYSVTGAADNSHEVKNLFYINNEENFLAAVQKLRNAKIEYIAITKRMEEGYLLMVNYPQKPILTKNLFDRNLKKEYQNKAVTIYKTK